MHFSVVVPAYNAESTLAETLDALLAQEADVWDCVVVDDGSTDSTAEIAGRYSRLDSRIHVVSQANMGSAGAYNTGVEHASGDLIVLCSADDILLPRYMTEMQAFVDREPGYDIYSTNGYFWRPDGSRELVYPPGTRDWELSLTLADVIRLCFYSVGAAYKREWHSRIGGYRLDVFGEDYDFWLRAMASGAKHRYLPEALSLHRLSAVQKSANVERAYRSDIRLVQDLSVAYDLTAEEFAAVDERISARERAIAQLSSLSPQQTFLRRAFAKAGRLLRGTRDEQR